MKLTKDRRIKVDPGGRPLKSRNTGQIRSTHCSTFRDHELGKGIFGECFKDFTICKLCIRKIRCLELLRGSCSRNAQENNPILPTCRMRREEEQRRRPSAIEPPLSGLRSQIAKAVALGTFPILPLCFVASWRRCNNPEQPASILLRLTRRERPQASCCDVP